MDKRELSRTGLFLTASVMGLLLSAGAAAAAPALPTGGSVTAGSASIASSGASMTISQPSPKAIIDWQGFSIGQGGSVQFNNGAGATLNRVTGTSGSAIDGLLSGTGSVYLINPNGVIVGKSGVVNVGGTFVASTLDVPNSSFLNGGDLVASGASTAAVVNEGKVGSLGGDVVMIARNVSNSGSLSAPNGTVGLLAGQSVLLRDQALNDGKFAVLVGGNATSVVNSGLVQAANAELRANGGNIYALAGDTAGVIRADGVRQGDGQVWLTAGNGSADVEGQIRARGPNGAGGSIETSAAGLKIGKADIDAGVGGSWLVDPYDLTIDAAAASSINGALGVGTNVTEQTTASSASGFGNQNPSGNGDIRVQAPISWSTGATLTLDAWRNISVTAPITVSGAGKAVLTYGGGGILDFGLGPTGFAGSLSFTGAEGAGQTLTINGAPYTLLYTFAEFRGGLFKATGRYAVAKDLQASPNHSGVTEFGGSLEGLGHVVDGLQVFTGSVGPMGLIMRLDPGAVVADLGSVNAAIDGSALAIGALVGENDGGTILRSYATGTVSGQYNVGGLVGDNRGLVDGSYASSTVRGATAVGGLVGDNTGVVTRSYATGDVTGWTFARFLGGLVGHMSNEAGSGQVSQSYATGRVSGDRAYGLGGLVGGMYFGDVSQSYATGEVSSTFPWSYVVGQTTGDMASRLGGLVGEDLYGGVHQSYATGDVTAYKDSGGLVGAGAGDIVDSYATGQVKGVAHSFQMGGLVGDFSTGQITRSYAAGGVSAGDGAFEIGGLVGSTGEFSIHIGQSFATGSVQVGDGAYDIGGLIGLNVDSGVVSQDYAIGAVAAGAGSHDVGGFIGHSNRADRIADSYFDTQTTGLTNAGAGAGAAVGLTTAQLQAALPSGFSNSDWGLIPGVSYPYQLSLFPETPQIVSGHAYKSAAGTPWTPGRSVAAVVDGSTALGAASIGADGAYYLIEPAGTLPAGSTLLAYIHGGKTRATTVVEQVADGANVIGLDLIAGHTIVRTPDASLSSTLDDLSRGLGPAVGPEVQLGLSGDVLTLDGKHLDLFADGPGFDFDRSLDLGSYDLRMTAAGAVTQSQGTLTLGSLSGSSGGGLALTSNSNRISLLRGWTASTEGIEIHDGQTLTVTGTIWSKAPDWDVMLWTTAGDIVLSGGIRSGNGGVGLYSAGEVVQTLSDSPQVFIRTQGPIVATAHSGIKLDGTNIGHDAFLNNFGSGAIDYSQLGNLVISFDVSNLGGGPVTITTHLVDGKGSLRIRGLIDGGLVTLNVAGGIREIGAGAIIADKLTGSAGGPVELNSGGGGGNLIGELGDFSSISGDFSLTNLQSLIQTGTLDSSGHTVGLTVSSGDLAVNGTVKATTLNLTSRTGALTESNTTGAIDVGLLNAAAHTGITLASPNNHITTVGTDTTVSGPNHIQQ